MALSDPQKVVRLRAVLSTILPYAIGGIGPNEDVIERARQALKDTAPTEPTGG